MNKIIKYIPNVLTFSRVFLLLIGLYLTLIGGLFVGALFVGASFLTDYADGEIARRFKVESKIGKIFDPILDALSIGIIYFFFFFYIDFGGSINLILKIMFGIIIFRNIFISQIFKYLQKRSEEYSNVSYIGKLSTATQMIAIVSYFAAGILLNSYQVIVFAFLFTISFVISLYSGFDYIKRGYEILKKK